MKRFYYCWLWAFALAAVSPALWAADVTITVNGKVVAKPCTVSTTNANVELGDLYTLACFPQAPPPRGTAWRLNSATARSARRG